MKSKTPSWVWKGFDFLQAASTCLQRPISSSRTALSLLYWYVTPGLTSGRTQQHSSSSHSRIDKTLKHHLSQLEKEHPHFLKRNDHPSSSPVTHVLLPHEAHFPIHWALFQALSASTEEWEEKFRDLTTPLVIHSASAFMEPSPMMQLYIVQKALGDSFWKACQDNELPFRPLQHRILLETVKLYFNQFFEHSTRLPSLKSVAKRARCHVNHAHRTLMVAMTTGMLTFHSTPNIFRLGGSLIGSSITTSLPSMLRCWMDFRNNNSPNDRNVLIYPWMLAPLGSRTWYITWAVTPFNDQEEENDDVLLSTMLNHISKHALSTPKSSNDKWITIGKLTSLLRWIDLTQYFTVPKEELVESENDVAWWEFKRSDSPPSISSDSKNCIPKLSALQQQLLYLLQHDFFTARTLARKFDVEPSTITRAVSDLKKRNLLVPNIIIRFLKPVHPVIMQVRGLEVTNMVAFLHQHVLQVQGLCSGLMWSTVNDNDGKSLDHEESADFYILSSVTDQSAPHKLARRLILSFDLQDDNIIVHDATSSGSFGPLIRPMIPHPRFLNPLNSMKQGLEHEKGSSPPPPLIPP